MSLFWWKCSTFLSKYFEGEKLLIKTEELRQDLPVSVLKKSCCWGQGAHYESTYNVNYKGEVGIRYIGFREKNNFYFPVSDKGSEKCHTQELGQTSRSHKMWENMKGFFGSGNVFPMNVTTLKKGQQLISPSVPVHLQLNVPLEQLIVEFQT